MNEPFVVVIGTGSSGSSCLAGVLWHLGLYMGNELGGSWGNQPGKQCGYESRLVRTTCEQCIPFLQPRIAGTPDELRHRLGKWINRTTMEANRLGQVPGGKHPSLSRLGPTIMELCGDHVWLVVADRDIEESTLSIMRRTHEQHDYDTVRAFMDWLAEGREEFVAMLPEERVCRVLYDDMLADPIQEATRLALFLGLTPTTEQLRDAAASVRPEMRHIMPARIEDVSWA